MNKKKIGVIGLKGLPSIGGAASVGENLINQLKKEFDFTVYSVESHTDLKSGQFNGIHQIVFRSINQKKLNVLLYYIKSAMHAVLFAKYDLIHLHHSDASFILLFLKLRYKVIVTTHGVHNLGELDKWKRYKLFFTSQIKYILPLANQITCVSKTEQKWLKNNYRIEATFIPNGVVTNKLDKTNDYDYTIFYGAGRIIQSKGCDVLLKALKNISFSDKIAIAGDLEQSHKFKQQIYRLAESLDVTFLGLIKDKNKLLNVMRCSKLFVYPTEMESMSMMLLEAASVNTPIICSDIIENKDIFQDDEVLYFSLDIDNDLEQKISWAIDNYDEMYKRSVRAHNRINETNNWETIASNYSKIYINLISNN